jgi:hypothetical protein
MLFSLGIGVNEMSMAPCSRYRMSLKKQASKVKTTETE